MEKLEKLLGAIQETIVSKRFVRLTLSKPRQKGDDLKKVIAKSILIKGKLHFSFIYRHQTKDITKNYELEVGTSLIKQLLSEQFYIANLFSTQKNWSYEIFKNGKDHLKSSAPTFIEPPTQQHDKTKNSLLVSADFLKELKVLDAKGRVRKDMGDKYKQIEKFVEILDALIRKNPKLSSSQKISVTDMGSGKGYLTFATYDFLKNNLKKEVSVTGVEVRDDLIDFCNQTAQKVGFENLGFKKGYISDYDLQATDILIALHACDTATDDAIFKGISAKAKLIVCAPCCHKQVRKAMGVSENLQSVLNYGILKERQAEIVTDTIRALLLEAHGYKTKVFEFISTEHTGKNVMIVGQRHAGKVDKDAILSKIEKLKIEFEIAQHYLETIL